ncbi:pollen-specific leucine-rich repeat extensin-like protein 2 [Schistocerca americana]|uniref:pollen-specific leucine-rich repeat extensin-like protein 2 n=1 Tax=Schistocerca americana TaxID=7009 RepID=UPI001F4F9008|nr:pollen-specific leucine-rich repeat extensin-like protein 2 [Schistocerca americana]
MQSAVPGPARRGLPPAQTMGRPHSAGPALSLSLPLSLRCCRQQRLGGPRSDSSGEVGRGRSKLLAAEPATSLLRVAEPSRHDSLPEPPPTRHTRRRLPPPPSYVVALEATAAKLSRFDDDIIEKPPPPIEEKIIRLDQIFPFSSKIFDQEKETGPSEKHLFEIKEIGSKFNETFKALSVDYKIVFNDANIAKLDTIWSAAGSSLPTSLPPPGQQQQLSPLPRRQPVPLMPPAQLHPGAPQVVAPAPAVPLQSPPPSELMDVDPSAGPPSQAVAVQPVLQPLSLGTPKESDTAAPCPAPTQQPSTQRQETLPLFVGPDAPSRPVPEAAPVVTAAPVTSASAGSNLSQSCPVAPPVASASAGSNLSQSCPVAPPVASASAGSNLSQSCPVAPPVASASAGSNLPRPTHVKTSTQDPAAQLLSMLEQNSEVLMSVLEATLDGGPSYAPSIDHRPRDLPPSVQEQQANHADVDVVDEKIPTASAPNLCYSPQAMC